MGAWIEIKNSDMVWFKDAVAPLVGAWIEIYIFLLLMRVPNVAPLVGAWIEIWSPKPKSSFACRVAPLVGAWIEIMNSALLPNARQSLPLWERGLKFKTAIQLH